MTPQKPKYKSFSKNTAWTRLVPLVIFGKLKSLARPGMETLGSASTLVIIAFFEVICASRLLPDALLSPPQVPSGLVQPPHTVNDLAVDAKPLGNVFDGVAG